MIKKTLLACGLWLLSLAPTMADTIHVEHVMMNGPVKMIRPFATDSVNLKGEKFDTQSFLKENASWALRPATQKLLRGQALLPASYNSDAQALVALQFTLQTQQFVKVDLNVGKLKNYKLYVNEKEQSGKSLRLTPGRTELTLLALTDTAKHDSLDLSLTGKHAALV